MAEQQIKLTSVDLKDIHSVVLLVHEHQLEIKYQENISQLIKCNYPNDGRIVVERDESVKIIGTLYSALKDLNDSELKELCRTFSLNTLNNIPNNYTKNDLIDKIVEDSKRIGIVEQIIDWARQIIDWARQKLGKTTTDNRKSNLGDRTDEVEKQ